MKIIFETMVGSHMWGMQHGGSDEDHFLCYLAPTREILSGELVYPVRFSHFEHGEMRDTSAHEAQSVVGQLIKGNVNFLWGVMSPVVVKTSKWHDELREIAGRNLAKNCYHSIHGLAVHNYRKYIESGKDTSEKRCNTIVRSIHFGIRILVEGRIGFAPVSMVFPEQVKTAMSALEQAYQESKLPERPNEKEFRDWLFRLRVSDLGY